MRAIMPGEFDVVPYGPIGCGNKKCKKCKKLDFEPYERPKREKTREEEYKDFDSGAVKEVSNKHRLDLVTPEMIEGLANPLAYGVSKYAARNWEKGIPLMTSYAAALRHLLKWARGIDVDEESGLLHIEQALCNIGMIVTQTARKRDDLDDRPKTN